MTSIVDALVRLARGACLALVATVAFASAPFVSGPSILSAAEAAQFRGGGFAAGTTVQVRLSHPAGNVAVQNALVANDGTVEFSVTADGQGVHQVTVLDLAGNVLASATFVSR